MALIGWLAVAANAHALHDPTRPTDPALYFGYQQSKNDTRWALQSILSSAERRIAIINGVRVREGDRIGPAKVVRIQKSQVLLHTGSGTLTLRLLPDTIKVKP